jgi:methyl-accepting chemotaxis protein
LVSAIFNRCRLKSDAVFQYAGTEGGYYMIPLEQRQAERVKTRKAGRIVLTNGSEIRCMIRNLSRSGAYLEVGSHFGIPRDILLEIEGEHFKRPCRIVRRSNQQLGVLFSKAAPVGGSKPTA